MHRNISNTRKSTKMHYHWQHPHSFHNTTHKHNGEWGEMGGGKPHSNNDPLTSVRGWRAKSSRRSFTQTVWNLPHSMSEPVRRPVNLLRGTTHGITQTSIWPTFGCWSICAQGNKGGPCAGMRGETKLNNCQWGEHELPPFQSHSKGGKCLNQEHLNPNCRNKI